ncbi:hypothetical protein PMIN06_003842 [Paraphaeosphaeria minitans]
MSMAFGAVGGIILVCFLVKDPINALDEARGSKVESRSVIRKFWMLDRESRYQFAHKDIRQRSKPQNLKLLRNGAMSGVLMSTKTFEFIQKYCLTFVAHNLRVPDVDEQKVFFSSWYHFTKYDLITFTNRNTKKILSKVKELKHNVSSQMPFKPVEFLDKTRHQDRALFSEYAVFWAMQ